MEVLLVWLLSFFLIVGLIGLVVYQLMCLADLELDYINPFETAARVNGTLKPEYVIQGVLCLAFLVTGHWLMFLFCLPYLYYNLRQYRQNQHLVDVTEIFNMLSWEKKQRLIKLAYLITLLFVSIFWMIFVVLDED
ncbi:protein cornichon homolog 4-like [Aristolochia californica]|uniref:protein cornichon homolog 4-like n=1 Tax=Aristolochia californica TaxID=171875 RepID=UPI0035DEE3B9